MLWTILIREVFALTAFNRLIILHTIRGASDKCKRHLHFLFWTWYSQQCQKARPKSPDCPFKALIQKTQSACSEDYCWNVRNKMLAGNTLKQRKLQPLLIPYLGTVGPFWGGRSVLWLKCPDFREVPLAVFKIFSLPRHFSIWIKGPISVCKR